MGIKRHWPEENETKLWKVEVLVVEALKYSIPSTFRSSSPLTRRSLRITWTTVEGGPVRRNWLEAGRQVRSFST